jgi:hypothetical protein
MMPAVDSLHAAVARHRLTAMLQDGGALYVKQPLTLMTLLFVALHTGWCLS